MNALELTAGTIQRTRITAGGPDKVSIFDLATILECHTFAGGIERHDFCAENEFDLLLGPVFGFLDVKAIKGFLAEQIFLGQRRTLIGRFVLAADYGNAARKSLLTQLDRSHAATLSSSDNDYIIFHIILSRSVGVSGGCEGLCLRKYTLCLLLVGDVDHLAVETNGSCPRIGGESIQNTLGVIDFFF